MLSIKVTIQSLILRILREDRPENKQLSNNFMKALRAAYNTLREQTWAYLILHMVWFGWARKSFRKRGDI